MKSKWLSISRILLILIISICIFHFWSDGSKIRAMMELRRQGIPPDEAFAKVHFICGPLNVTLIILLAIWLINYLIENRKMKKSLINKA